ncbi:MAG: ABC transporter ATP-binding protein/permease [Defluviitaleaceae bacterium]|nr:ABC transporter ATP-binding protein/permease [Defluviitaleaceae bacterium]
MRIIKLFFATLNKNGMQYKGFLLIYTLVVAVVVATSVLMDRTAGEMGQAAHYLEMDTLLQFLVLLTALSAIQAIAAAISALMLGRFRGKAGHGFRKNFARYFLHVPFGKLEKAGSGESLSAYSNDIPRSVSYVAGEEGMLMMIASVLQVIAGLIFMLTINVPITLIYFGMFPVLAVMQIVISLPIQKRQKANLEARAKFTAVVNDSLQNTSTIIAYGLEDVMEKRYLNTYKEFMASVKAFALAFLPLVLIGQIISMSPIIILNFMAANQAIEGYMSIAEFIALTSVALIAASSLLMLSQQLGWLQTGAAGAKRVDENTSHAIENLNDGSKIDISSPANISFENVSFTYLEDEEDAPLALDGVSFSIKPGNKVAFVGGSGSGKSTVLKLLLGLYTPQSGKIIIDGKDLVGVAKSDLRNKFAYVPQDSFLFPESIGENISLNGASDGAKLEKACKDAGIWDFVQALPEKFDGVLSEGSENISGGQRQRIALARAFYKDAPVILFDEATSALDPTTEAAILESLNAAAKDKTVIMVAHRTAAIAACDVIVLLDGGKISAIGSHEELSATSELYQSLSRTRNNGGGQNGK